MIITDMVLIVFIVALLAWAIYDELILDYRHGQTRLAIPLLRRGRADSAIFIGLLAILIYNNISAHGAVTTTWLLGGLGLIAMYLFWLRVPKIRFKSTRFYFAGGWTEYNHIKAMNLSEDGILVFQLDMRRLLVRVKSIEDVENIYQFIVKNQ